jgi:hypothetical protein
MSLRLGRAAFAALLFLGAQIAPGIHSALEGAHEVHVCCTDSERSTHFDACGADHHAPPCPVCAAVRAPASTATEVVALTIERAPVPSTSIPDEIHVDPFHVDVPASRGPPA